MINTFETHPRCAVFFIINLFTFEGVGAHRVLSCKELETILKGLEKSTTGGGHRLERKRTMRRDGRSPRHEVSE
jgi:hypothetical protein